MGRHFLDPCDFPHESPDDVVCGGVREIHVAANHRNENQTALQRKRNNGRSVEVGHVEIEKVTFLHDSTLHNGRAMFIHGHSRAVVFFLHLVISTSFPC